MYAWKNAEAFLDNLCQPLHASLHFREAYCLAKPKVPIFMWIYYRFIDSSKSNHFGITSVGGKLFWYDKKTKPFETLFVGKQKRVLYCEQCKISTFILAEGVFTIV